MMETGSIVGMQVEALMALLEQARKDHCEQAREVAQLEADGVLRRARQAARARVRLAAGEERARLEHEVRMVEAEIETERRRQARRREGLLIEAGRDLLAAALAERWQRPDGRQEWTTCVLEEAAAVLLAREWLLEHPPAWPAEELREATRLAQERYGAVLQARPVEEIPAGLRVRSGGALVDMSIAGLLANHSVVEGELLAEFRRVAEGEPS